LWGKANASGWGISSFSIVDVKRTEENYEKESEAHLQRHIILARYVTLLQVAIAISAISIITRRRFLWYIAMLIALGRIWFFIPG
jgi:hypothetical protein